MQGRLAHASYRNALHVELVQDALQLAILFANLDLHLAPAVHAVALYSAAAALKPCATDVATLSACNAWLLPYTWKQNSLLVWRCRPGTDAFGLWFVQACNK
jgi:hypothetical protein